MPELVSIGLGGGSHISIGSDGAIDVGPTSVGHNLLRDSQCAGGQVLTASDVAVKAGLLQGLGDAGKVRLSADEAGRVLDKIRLSSPISHAHPMVVPG